MNKTDRDLIIDRLDQSGRFSVFNGELFFKSKDGWKSITNEEIHLFRGILKHIRPDGWDHNDISTVEKSIYKRTEPIRLKTSTNIYTPNYLVDVANKKTTELTAEQKEELHISIKRDFRTDKKSVAWWDKMLSNALNGEEDAITAYYEMIGLSMITDKKFEVSYWITGKAGTGKSTIVNTVIEGIHHSRNISNLEPTEWNSSSALFYQMANKLVNISSDNANERSLETGAFKKLVSGEMVNANIKYKDPINFKSTALLISIGNSMPIIKEATDGPYRRMIMLKMNNKIRQEDKDVNTKDYILSNKDGVLDYIIYRGIKALNRLFDRGEPTIPQMSHESIKEQKINNDNVYDFFINEGHRLDDLYKTCLEGSGLAWVEILKVYNEWTRETNTKPYGKNNFKERAIRVIEEEKLNYSVKKVNNKEYLLRTESHIPVKTEAEIERELLERQAEEYMATVAHLEDTGAPEYDF